MVNRKFLENFLDAIMVSIKVSIVNFIKYKILMKKDYIIFLNIEAALFNPGKRSQAGFNFKDFLSYLSRGQEYLSTRGIDESTFLTTVFDSGLVSNLSSFVNELKNNNFVPKFVITCSKTPNYATQHKLETVLSKSSAWFINLHNEAYCKVRTQALEVNKIEWWLKDNSVNSNFMVFGDYGFYSGLVDTIDKLPRENYYGSKGIVSSKYTVLCKTGFSEDVLQKANILLNSQLLEIKNG